MNSNCHWQKMAKYVNLVQMIISCMVSSFLSKMAKVLCRRCHSVDNNGDDSAHCNRWGYHVCRIPHEKHSCALWWRWIIDLIRSAPTSDHWNTPGVLYKQLLCSIPQVQFAKFNIWVNLWIRWHKIHWKNICSFQRKMKMKYIIYIYFLQFR